MNRPILYGILLLSLNLPLFAQVPCAFDEGKAKREFRNHPGDGSPLKTGFDGRTQSVVTIPVVVHVIWHDPSENISDAQIQSQLDVLNEDFRKLNADTGVLRPLFAPIAGDAQIEFCLAQRDPQGNATNGITRTYSSVTDWGCVDSMKYSANGGADGWPGADYLNIWVCKLNCANGYAYYPGTPDPIDGVVVHYYVFGRTGNVAPGYHGRTGVHEVGHYLGLYHTFDYTGNCDGSDTSNCLTAGDYVCDTPADNNPDFGCPPFVNDCADSPVDLPDLTENYMDYGDDDCRVMFTLGQIERMRGFVFTDRISLLTSLGCIPPFTTYFDVGILTLEEPHTDVCTGSVAPVIRIANTSSGTLISLDIQYALDTSGFSTFNWNGSIPPGTSDTIVLPLISPAPGSHLLHILLDNPNGQIDQNMANNSGEFPINVISAGLAIPFAEGFESGGFPYPHWSVEDPDNHYGWVHTFLAGAPPGSASMRIRNFYNQSRNTYDGLLPPVYDLTGTPAAALTFDVAYSDPNSTYYSDTLRLLYSLDCGLTWTLLWQDGGASLATAPAPAVFSEFVPDSTQWENHQVSLNQFLGAPLFSLKFENKNGWGNDLYLDNINLSIPTGMNDFATSSPVLFPNPAKEFFALRFPAPVYELEVLIFTLEGEKVSTLRLNANGNQSIIAKLPSLARGIYLLEVRLTGSVSHLKLITE